MQGMSGKRQNRRLYIGQQPGTKGGRRPVEKRRVNRWFCSPIGLHRGFFFFVLPETRPGGFSTTVWRVAASVVSWTNRPVGVLCCPSPPYSAVQPCAAAPIPAHGMSGLWARQGRGSVASGAERLVGVTVLPIPAPLRRPAVRRAVPTRPCCMRVSIRQIILTSNPNSWRIPTGI